MNTQTINHLTRNALLSLHDNFRILKLAGLDLRNLTSGDLIDLPKTHPDLAHEAHHIWVALGRLDIAEAVLDLPATAGALMGAIQQVVGEGKLGRHYQDLPSILSQHKNPHFEENTRKTLLKVLAPAVATDAALPHPDPSV